MAAVDIWLLLHGAVLIKIVVSMLLVVPGANTFIAAIMVTVVWVFQLLCSVGTVIVEVVVLWVSITVVALVAAIIVTVVRALKLILCVGTVLVEVVILCCASRSKATI